MEYIRRFYGVPARRYGRVMYGTSLGTIVGAKVAYLRIRLDGETQIKTYHPEYLMTYL
jgi:hypothetical protein